MGWFFSLYGYVSLVKQVLGICTATITKLRKKRLLSTKNKRFYKQKNRKEAFFPALVELCQENVWQRRTEIGINMTVFVGAIFIAFVNLKKTTSVTQSLTRLLSCVKIYTILKGYMKESFRSNCFGPLC